MNLFRRFPLFSWHHVRGLALRLHEVTEAADRERLERELGEALGYLRRRLTDTSVSHATPSGTVSAS